MKDIKIKVGQVWINVDSPNRLYYIIKSSADNYAQALGINNGIIFYKGNFGSFLDNKPVVIKTANDSWRLKSFISKSKLNMLTLLV